MGEYQYLFVPKEGNSLSLGGTPDGLFYFLKDQGIPVKTVTPNRQADSNKEYAFVGEDGLKITARESNGGDRVIVSGSITRDSKRQVSVMAGRSCDSSILHPASR